MEVDTMGSLTDEEYVIHRAKSALKSDPLSAKAWMITAKTLYPNNFGVQVCIILLQLITAKVVQSPFSIFIRTRMRRNEYKKEGI